MKPHPFASPAALLALGLVLGPASASRAPGQELRMPKVELDFDKDVDFSHFKTFRWKDDASHAPTHEGHTRIVWYVERELEKKGLRKVGDAKPDLLLDYYAKAEESLKGSASQGESYLPGGTGSLSTSVDFSKVTAASLLIEMQRASDEKTVWRAASGYRSLDRKRVDAETASAVRRLLAKYPPPKP
jgi:hypothetical protein